MACKFFDSNTRSPEFLINLSPWINFQGDTISDQQFQNIKNSLQKDFIIDSDENLVDAIKEYIRLFSYNTELNTILNNSLDKILTKNIEKTLPPEEYKNPDPLVTTLENEVKTIEEDESVTEEDRDLATKEYVEQLNRSRKNVTYNEEIKTNRDLITKFQNNNSLYNRFVSTFKREIFKNSFLNLDSGKIVQTYSELNNNIAEYKQILFNHITKFLGEKDIIPLYNQDGSFNITEFTTIISRLNEYYDQHNPTSKLNSINNVLYTPLSKSNQDYLNAYNALVTLENFDNLIVLLTDGLISIDPFKLGIKSTNRNEIKYLPFTKNALRQHFRVNEDSDINRETTSLTKAIIQNIPLLDSDGKWDEISYMTVNEFNNAISRIGDPVIKSSNKYNSLKLGKLNPTVAYIEFFNSLFVTDGKTDPSKINKFKKNLDFNLDTKKALLSIYKYIFDSTPEAKSLYNIIKDNQGDLSFNYFLDVLAYMNKQDGSEYISYEYNSESKEYEVNTFSNLTYESSLFRQERNLTEYVDSIARNGDYDNTILNVLRNKFRVKVLDDSISITIGSRTLFINDHLNIANEDAITGKDLNKELLDSITIPNPEQVSAIINGKTLSESIMNGFRLLELLQLSTDLPFINSSGQLYSILKSQYRTEAESNLKGDLLGLLYRTLKTIDTLDSIYKEYDSNKVNLTPGEFKSKVKKSFPEFKTMKDITFNKFFTSSKTRPRLKVNLNSKGDRSSVFKATVSSINLLNREASPSTYKNSDGDNVPSIGLMNLVKNIHEFIYTTKDYQNNVRKHSNISNIFESNIFYNNPEYLKGIGLKTEFISPNGTTVQKNKFNISEYGVSSIILDYFKNLMDDQIDYIEFLPTVYADKSNQSLIKISKDIKFDGKNIKSASAAQIEVENFNSQQIYYTNLLSNLFKSYYKIGEGLGVSLLDSIPKIKNKKEKAEIINNNIIAINNLLSTRWKEVSQIVRELSLEDPNFKFIEEVHYSKVEMSKGNSVFRLNPFIENMANIYQVSTTDDSYYKDFINRSREIFKKDLKSKGIEVDTKVFKFLKDIPSLKNWIGRDGMMILEKDGKLNPILEKYFFLDGFLSNQFLQVSVGEPYAHPSKLRGVYYLNSDGSINPEYFIRDHANRLLAQYKRMVAMQATIHNYYQKALEGTIPTINVAIIKDIEAPVFNPSGETDNVKVLDGSMECNPFQNVLENNSMFSSSAGYNRKNFGYNVDPEFGNGLLMKCAIFSITNYRMRKSPEKVKLLQKMTDRKWDVPIINLMQDFNGNKRHLRDIISEDLYYYNTNDGEYYRIIDLESLGNNTYNIIERRVNNNGGDTQNSRNVTRTVVIDSNYKLWKALGGEYSYSLDNSNPLDPYLSNSGDKGEASVNATVQFMNKTGYYITKRDLLDMVDGDLDLLNTIISKQDLPFTFNNIPEDSSYILDEHGKLRVILDQNYIYQPLKYSDIHYLANGTSIKVGAFNTNPANARYDDTPLSYGRVGTQFMGIQMDADHHADLSTVTESTQIISTLAANGYTSDLADAAYRALGSVVNTTLKKYFEAHNQANNLETLTELGEANKTLLYKLLAKATIKAFEGSSGDGVITGYLEEAAREFEENLNNELFNARDLRFKIPFSSGSINSSFITMLASKMNSDSIKRTFSGMGAVMIPSYGSIKHYYFDGSENLFDSNGNVLRGYYSQEDLIHIANEAGYYSFTDENGNILKSGLDRYLETGNLTQEISTDLIEFGDIILDPTTGEQVDINTYDKFKHYRNLNTTVTNLKGIRKELQPFRATWSIDGVNKKYNIYDHPIIEDMFRLRESKASKEEILALQHFVNRYIGLLDENIMLLDPRMPEYQTIIDNNDIIEFGEGLQGVRIHDLNIKRAQAVISKVYQSIFGLRTGDNIANIINSDGEYFRQKLLRTYNKAKSDPLPNDIEFLKNSLDNTRIIINKPSSENYISSLTPMEILTESIDGEEWRLNENGEAIYKTSGLHFYQNTSNGIVQEVIVVDPSNLGNLVNVFNSSDEYIGIWYNFNSDNIKELRDYINMTNQRLGEELDINNSSIEELGDKYNRYINKRIGIDSKKIYRSFIESLKITANRIPAQAFQSIMTMDVIGFSDAESNEAYVSLYQTWLQGSDFRSKF